jgi:adenosylcobinamide kinase/adenosylcobinamide-phosphate guanylyltransferase
MDQSEQMQCLLIFVTNEVGAGIVPENKLARDFRDIVGAANQLVAQRCDEVIHMVSGIPVTIKTRSTDL